MTTDPASRTDAELVAQLHRIRLSSTTDVTVPDQLVSALLTLSRRTNQPVRATLSGEAAGRTIGFHLNQGRRTIERYVRFVRAAKIVATQPQVLRLSRTAGGHVRYVDVAMEPGAGRQPDRTSLLRNINQLFETATWSYNGPRDEFRRGGPAAAERPGGDGYPVLQRFDFIGVLYNPPDSGAAGILNVTYYRDSFIALRKDSPVERLEPLPV